MKTVNQYFLVALDLPDYQPMISGAKDGVQTGVLYIHQGPRSKLNKLFNLLDQNWNQSGNLDSYEISFVYPGFSANNLVQLKASCVGKNYFLTVEVETSTNKNALDLMTELDHKITIESREFDGFYFPTVIYDSVSEYYCGRLFPRIAKFERLLRQLLWTTYITWYGREFVQTAISERTRNLARSKNRSKMDMDRYYAYLFEDLSFGNYVDILFTDTWLPVDEKEKENFLRKNKDLTKLSDQALREQISKLRPRSTWDRLFSNKLIPYIKADLIKLSTYRNTVAHNKRLTKSEYSDAVQLIKKTTNVVKNAIKVVEKQDFPRKNLEQFSISLENIIENLREMMETFSQQYSSFLRDSFAHLISTFKNFTLLTQSSGHSEKPNDEYEENEQVSKKLN